MLRQALESVFAQSFRDLEIIVIDDGSVDRPDAAVQQFACAGEGLPAQGKLRLLRTPGVGNAAARNVGLADARGSFIAFLDDDDLWERDKLLVQTSFMNENPDVGVVCSRIARVDEVGRVLRDRLRERLKRPKGAWWRLTGRLAGLRGPALRHMLRSNRVVPSSAVIRREAIEECGGFDETLFVAADWDLFLRIAEKWQIVELPEKLVRYRVHTGRVSARRHEMRVAEVALLSKAWRRLQGRPESVLRILRRRLAWAHYRLGRSYLRRGQKPCALWHFSQSVRIWPFHLRPWLWLCAEAFLREGGASKAVGCEAPERSRGAPGGLD
jgi:glycosyltransferase involved in cell wall biosynthesis